MTQNTCPKCGAPEHRSGYDPFPNPIRFLGSTAWECLLCSKTLMGTTHSWQYKDSRRHICCGCYCRIRDSTSQEQQRFEQIIEQNLQEKSNDDSKQEMVGNSCLC